MWLTLLLVSSFFWISPLLRGATPYSPAVSHWEKGLGDEGLRLASLRPLKETFTPIQNNIVL
jgi:hypothetical protein